VSDLERLIEAVGGGRLTIQGTIEDLEASEDRLIGYGVRMTGTPLSGVLATVRDAAAILRAMAKREEG
jgi:hypothetical protein